MLPGPTSPFCSPMNRHTDECHRSDQLFQSATWASNTLGLSQPGTLELSEGSQRGGEIIVQGDVGWSDRMRLQEDGGRLARFLNQPGHVVREPLGVADFKTKGPRRLKLSLAHPEPSRYWRSPPIAE